MARVPDPVESRAIIIGTSDYELPDELPPLRAVRSNLSGLEYILTDPVTGVFPYEHCTVIDSPDSPSSLMRRLSRAASEALDVLLVYYAGHGVLGRNGDLHLAVRQTDPHQAAGTAVPFEWVKQTIQDSSAKVRILILDCCFSGRAIGAMSSSSAALEQVDVRGTFILTSTEANKISHAVPGERYTAFTGELIKLLSDNQPVDEPTTLQGLYRPLQAAMARRGLPRPKSVLGDAVGDLLLRKPLPINPKTPPEPVSTQQSPIQVSHAPQPEMASRPIERPQLHTEPYTRSWPPPKPVKITKLPEQTTFSAQAQMQASPINDQFVRGSTIEPVRSRSIQRNWVTVRQYAWIILWWAVALFFGMGLISYITLAITGANPPGVLGSIIAAVVSAGVLATAVYMLVRAARRRKTVKARTQDMT